MDIDELRLCSAVEYAQSANDAETAFAGRTDAVPVIHQQGIRPNFLRQGYGLHLARIEMR